MWRTIIPAVLLLVGLTSYYSKNVVKPEDKGKTADILEEHLILEEVPSERDLAHICDLKSVSCEKAKSPTPDIKTANLTPRTPQDERLEVGYTKSDITAIIEREAVRYGVSPNLMLDISWCESRFDPEARNPNSTATGLFQFLSGTWQEGCRRKGWDCTLDDRLDPKLNAELAAYFISIGQVSRWNASKLCWK